MTWTATETPHEGDLDAAGLGGGPGPGREWVAEPLAPGALGATPASRSGGGDDDELRADLPPLPLTGPLAEALTAARAAADAAAAAACYLASVGAQQRVQALRQAARARDVLDATLLRLTASFTPEDLDAVGATSPTDLLLTHTGADERRASSEARLATALTAPVGPLPGPPDPAVDDAVPACGDDAPGRSAEEGSVAQLVRGEGLGRVGEQHAAGNMSTDIASLARRTLESLPRRIQRAFAAEADHLLATTLPGLTHPQAKIACEVLAHKLDPSRADRGFDPDAIDKRYLHYTVHDDGTVDVRAHLDAVTGAELKAAIDHYARPEPTVRAPIADQPLPGLSQPDGRDSGDSGDSGRSEQGAGRERPGVPVRDERTAAQRRADALGLLARLGRTSDETRGGEPPRIIITATTDQVMGVPGAGRATCETTRRSLSTTQLQHLACSALLHTVTLSCQGPDAAALALGRTVRLFSPAQRRAMLARDGGCVIPGCTAPPGWLEAHHTHEWSAGGPTDVEVGVLLCGRHHVLVTLGIWDVRMVDGAPRVRPPASIDPLQRWLLNPRRALEHSTAQRAEQLLLPGTTADVGSLPSAPMGRGAPPPTAPPVDTGPDDVHDGGPDAGPDDRPIPDIDSSRGTCGC
ncbi:HNH endonuclease signature motif containing protein [Quadrisphaera setariae]|uniref:DUF222 domain-containing protein n=1 Tax=Quadrisphaera setariae TaxID=2593304 RepID=A0A5C8Z0J0_9ACTN|nr:HNH endonuclease signature motif containing protein [Quadrisphaera setariae]TXR51652.1 DUF222 domain-containing protein [Quadrisphaera setariae]